MIRSTLMTTALTWLGAVTLMVTSPFMSVVIPILVLVVAVAVPNARHALRPSWPSSAAGWALALAFLGPLGLAVVSIASAASGGWASIF